MPSPRSRFETACRIGAFGLLGWLLGTSVIPAVDRSVARISTQNFNTRITEVTRSAATSPVHFEASATPDAWMTDWLAALDNAGRPVTWSGVAPQLTVVTQPAIDPRGGTRIDVSAPQGSDVVLHDDASVIDSVRVQRLGASVLVPVVAGEVRAQTRGVVARASTGDSAELRAVIVIGAAGWEGKYVVSALEERGWPVIARFSVAPNIDVTDGWTSQLDTSHVGAVIAIDSTVASLGASLEQFVRSGGGLILAGNSASAANVRAIAPGASGSRTRPIVRSTDTMTLGATGFYPVTNVRGDGLVLERRAGGVTMAARRVGAGRVLQLGYDDSWRWRMAGVSGSEAAHRAWWTRVVASVAYVPVAHVSPFSLAASAPTAYFIDRLGPTRLLPPGAGSVPVDRRILITLILILLIMEWASRRTRGLR